MKDGGKFHISSPMQKREGKGGGVGKLKTFPPPPPPPRPRRKRKERILRWMRSISHPVLILGSGEKRGKGKKRKRLLLLWESGVSARAHRVNLFLALFLNLFSSFGPSCVLGMFCLLLRLLLSFFDTRNELFSFPKMHECEPSFLNLLLRRPPPQRGRRRRRKRNGS